MSKYLGIDSSTQSITGLLIDTENNTIVAEESINFDEHFKAAYGVENGVFDLGNGAVHSAPLMWAEALDLLLQTLKDQGHDLSEIDAIAGSGQQHGTVYLNNTAALALQNISSAFPLKDQLAGIFSRDTTPIWRADQPPIQYLTHDLGPLLEVLDDRCISVSCRSAPCHSPDAPMRSDGQIALFETAKGTLIKIMVTLNTRRPSEHRYRIFGIEGGTEWFSYEKAARRFSREADHKDGWDVIPIGLGAHGDDTSAGHGGADLKTARHFTRAILAGTPAPIDVYRAIEYTLPGILANKSADLGGAPVPIPDIRRTPFTHTHFWDSLGLPDVDPDPIQYQALA